MRPAPRRSIAPVLVVLACIAIGLSVCVALIIVIKKRSSLASITVVKESEEPDTGSRHAPRAVADGTRSVPATQEPSVSTQTSQSLTSEADGAASQPASRDDELSSPAPQQMPSPRQAFPAPSRGLGATRPNGAFAQAPTPALPARKEDDLDTRIGQSMQKAVDLILSRFNGPELARTTDPNPVYRAGLHALCVYALLQAGQSLDDERLSMHGKLMPQLIEAMKSHSLQTNGASLGDPVTYAHSLRAAALALYNRNEDAKTLKADVAWLVKAQRDGAYTYDDVNSRAAGPMDQMPWDNSNSQYGLLGTWAGAEVGMEVPLRYWEAVDKHWKSTQQRDGQWTYAPYKPTTSLSMTCGGIASLMVTYDYLDIPKLRGAVGRDPFPGQIGLGLKWLETADNCLNTPNPETFYIGYDLYSLERVGLASGLKFFGKHDWYRELAEQSLKLQWPTGAFGRETIDDDTIIGTAYTLLFLARGRHPVFMEKLRFDEYWANRPRDIANLARYASKQLERPLNWQVVSTDRQWQDWFDSPVLYIASHQPPQLTDEQYANLRAFVEAGGLIFTQADGGSEAFNKWVPELVRRICPEYELQTLPKTHLLYSIYQKIKLPTKLEAISNGSRLMLVHCPFDFAVSWQQRDDEMWPDRFNLALNIFIYAAGKTDFRNRVVSPWVPPPSGEPTWKLRLARISYAGNWDPEPYAWTRFARVLQTETSKALDIQSIAAKDLAVGVAPIAHLTGTASYHFTDAEVAAIKTYVESGGILLIDSTGGQPAFASSIEKDLLPRAFPVMKLAPIPPDHPLLANLSLRLRPYAMDQFGRQSPPIQLAQMSHGYVIFTPLDVTAGLLDTNTWGILGYTPQSCEQFMRNLVTWSAH